VPVVARTEIDYLRPARLGDPLLITAELSKMEKVRFFISFTMTSATQPDVTFIRCIQTMVTVQLPEGRPRRVPLAWSEAYPHLIAT
jgi:acyl-CoA thioester hydrolase